MSFYRTLTLFRLNLLINANASRNTRLLQSNNGPPLKEAGTIFTKMEQYGISDDLNNQFIALVMDKMKSSPPIEVAAGDVLHPSIVPDQDIDIQTEFQDKQRKKKKKVLSLSKCLKGDVMWIPPRIVVNDTEVISDDNHLNLINRKMEKKMLQRKQNRMQKYATLFEKLHGISAHIPVNSSNNCTDDKNEKCVDVVHNNTHHNHTTANNTTTTTNNNNNNNNNTSTDQMDAIKQTKLDSLVNYLASKF